MQYIIRFLVALLLNICPYSDGKDAKFTLQEFTNDYMIIAKACQAIGFVKCCSTQDEKHKVAFTAAVTSINTTWSGGTLIFNVVITNIGGGYNPKSGVFTAPLNGTYAFYISGVEYFNQDLRLDIVLNNVSQVRMMGNDYTSYQTGTNMVVLSLQNGDRVWARHFHGKGYFSQAVPLTTFTGFMI